MERRRVRPPWPLATACLLIIVEAAALVGLSVAFVVDVVRGAVGAVGTTIAMTVFFLGLAGLLVLAARALARGQRWGRGPVLTFQLILLASALSTIGSGPVVPAGMVVLAVASLAGLLAPSSREHLTRLDVPPGVA